MGAPAVPGSGLLDVTGPTPASSGKFLIYCSVLAVNAGVVQKGLESIFRPAVIDQIVKRIVVAQQAVSAHQFVVIEIQALGRARTARNRRRSGGSTPAISLAGPGREAGSVANNCH